MRQLMLLLCLFCWSLAVSQKNNLLDSIGVYNSQANFYYQKGDYKNANEKYKKVVKILSKKELFNLEVTKPILFNILVTIKGNYILLQNYNEASKYSKKMLQFPEPFFDKINLDYGLEIISVSSNYLMNNKIDSASIYFNKAKKFYKKITDKNSLNYIFYQNLASNLLFQKLEFEKGYENQKIVLQKLNSNPNYSNYVRDNELLLATFAYQLKKYQEAHSIFGKYLSEVLKILEVDAPFNAKAPFIDYLASYLNTQKILEKEMNKEHLNILKKHIDKHSELTLKLLPTISKLTFLEEYYYVLDKLNTIDKKSYERNVLLKTSVLYQYAVIFDNLKDKDLAYSYYSKLLDAVDGFENLNKYNFDSYFILNRIIENSTNNFKFREGIEYYSSILSQIIKEKGKQNEIYLSHLDGYARVLMQLGDTHTSLKVLEDLIIASKKVNTNYSKHLTIIATTNLASINANLGKTTTAINSLKLLINSLAKNSNKIVEPTLILTHLYFNKKEYDNAKKTLKRLDKVEDQDYFIKNDELSSIYANLQGKILSHFKNPQSTFYLDIAVSNSEKIHSKESIEYNSYYLDYLVEKARDEKYINTSFTARSMQQSLPYIDAFKGVNQNLTKKMKSVFAYRTEQEKNLFLTRVIPLFNSMYSLCSRFKNDSISSVCYENKKNYKGLILNNTINNLRIMRNSKEAKYKSLLEDYSYNKKILTKEVSHFKGNQKKLDSLYWIAQNYERQLLDAINEIKNKGSNRVKKTSLNSKDIIIDFSHFNYYNGLKQTDSTIYIAYLLKKDWQHPKIVNLFEQKQLQKTLKTQNPNRLYTSRGGEAKFEGVYGKVDSLYQYIWKPIEKHLKDVKTIYYSPDGILHQIPFSALHKKGDSTLNKKYNLIQLSSTNKIDEGFIEPKKDNFLIIGDINYDLVSNQVKKEKKKSIKLNIVKGKSNKRGDGDTWDYLSGTKTEIDSITHIFDTENIKYKILSQTNASETTFKKLDGNSPKILHIATHGFFYENLPKKPTNTFSLSKNIFKTSEDPLLRSGLLLSGANDAWKNGINTNKENDGILTALEISNMDLSNTELVVLSACETGLGDISGSEGVYGLQRAFKMAGVDLIMMSLWKVPDKETAEFMSLFYKKWTSGLKIRAAFQETQLLMQNRYSDEPEKWAGFVLFE